MVRGDEELLTRAVDGTFYVTTKLCHLHFSSSSSPATVTLTHSRPPSPPTLSVDLLTSSHHPCQSRHSMWSSYAMFGTQFYRISLIGWLHTGVQYIYTLLHPGCGLRQTDLSRMYLTTRLGVTNTL